MKFLVIDDDQDFRKLTIQRMQAEFPDAIFVDFAGRREFDEALKRWDFDVVITDLDNPGLDGLTVCWLIRERDPHLPVIMLTASGNEELAVEGMKSGLSDYVTKHHLLRLPVAIREGMEKAKLRKEYEKAHEQIKIDKNRIEFLLKAGPAVIYSVNPSDNYSVTFMSENVKALLVYESREFVMDTQFWNKHIHPEDLSHVTGKRARLQEVDSMALEYRFMHKDGMYRSMYDEVNVVRDTSGNPIEIIGYWADITERKRLESTKTRLTSIVEATTDFVVTAYVNGHVFYINKAGRKITGIGEDEDISGLSVPDFYPEWARAAISNEVLPTAISTGVWSGETALLSCDKREISISQVVIAHKSPDGIVEYFSIIARDITDRKRFETQIVHIANHDPLTGLFNRRRLKEELNIWLLFARRSGPEGLCYFLTWTISKTLMTLTAIR